MGAEEISMERWKLCNYTFWISQDTSPFITFPSPLDNGIWIDHRLTITSFHLVSLTVNIACSRRRKCSSLPLKIFESELYTYYIQMTVYEKETRPELTFFWFHLGNFLRMNLFRFSRSRSEAGDKRHINPWIGREAFWEYYLYRHSKL